MVGTSGYDAAAVAAEAAGAIRAGTASAISARVSQRRCMVFSLPFGRLVGAPCRGALGVRWEPTWSLDTLASACGADSRPDHRKARPPKAPTTESRGRMDDPTATV